MNTLSKFLSLLLIVAVSFVGCKSFTNGYNNDPNNPTDSPPDLMLTGAQVGMLQFMEAGGARLAGMWDGHFTGSDRQYVALNNYNVTAREFDEPWSQAYADVLGQTKIIRNKADNLNNRIIKGIAGVVQAQTAGMVASLWGNVPYSQYGDVEKYPNPKYDDQASVFSSVQSLLDASIADLQSGQGINPGEKDIFYGGDTSKWVEAAYTLKARFYLQTGEYQKAYQASQKGISTSDNDMMGAHTGSVYNGDMNTYFSFCVYDRPAYMSANQAAAPDIFLSSERNDSKTNDMARAYFTYVYPNYLGDIYNSGPELNFVDNPVFGLGVYRGFYASNHPFPLVTYAENELIKAEALTMNGPQQSLSDAITALNNERAWLRNDYDMGSWESLLSAPRQYDDYVMADFLPGTGMADVTNGSGTAQDNIFYKIIQERFLTLGGTYSTFNDIRRTDNVLGIPANKGSKIPQRFLIPQSEVNSNANVPSTQPGLFDPTPVNQQASAKIKASIDMSAFPNYTMDQLQKIRIQKVSELRKKVEGTGKLDGIKKAYDKVMNISKK